MMRPEEKSAPIAHLAVGAVCFGSGYLGGRTRIGVTRQSILGLELADARTGVNVLARRSS